MRLFHEWLVRHAVSNYLYIATSAQISIILTGVTIRIYQLFLFSAIPTCFISIFYSIQWANIKPYPLISALFKRDFKIVRIGQFGRFICQQTQKICEILWVYNKKFQTEIPDSQLYQNSLLLFLKNPNLQKISDMD